MIGQSGPAWRCVGRVIGIGGLVALALTAAADAGPRRPGIGIRRDFGRPAPAAATGPRGIFVYREQVTSDPNFQQALGTPGVDGMAVVLDWAAIQPTDGPLVTDPIAAQLADARSHNMPIELVIRAGASTPAWVSPSARLKLAYATHGGTAGRCEIVETPPPWDAGYQAAFAATLHKTAGYLARQHVTVAAVKLTGVNATTEEMRLPAETIAETSRCPGGGVDDVEVWRAAGFTPSRLTQATNQLARAFATEFPGVPVTLAMIPKGPFPPIDDPTGPPLSGPKKAALYGDMWQAIVGDASAALPGRLVLQFDYLNTGQPANPKVVALARRNGLPLAWQTNLWRGSSHEGAGCGGSPGHGNPCSDEQYLALLQAGIHPKGGSGASAQGLYIEVFAYDVVAHPSAIAEAHRELLGLPLPERPPPRPSCPPGRRCPRPT